MIHVCDHGEVISDASDMASPGIAAVSRNQKVRVSIMPETSIYDWDVPTAKHRRTLHPSERSKADPVSMARCTGHVPANSDRCFVGTCPRHEPETYADCMARHTPESIITPTTAQREFGDWSE